MRLAIADPPYLGRAEMFYGAGNVANMNVGGNIHPMAKSDHHPDAAAWDDIEKHRELVARLVDEFDGWAIAMVPDNLHEYLPMVPRRTRVAVWHNPMTMPAGQHPRRRWEPVLVYVPDGRRRVRDVAGPPVVDVLTVTHELEKRKGFAGAKPRAWTRWVLGMLGYDPDADEVVDLFPGSGAVAAEIAQGVLW
jgi:hypothetical protein